MEPTAVALLPMAVEPVKTTFLTSVGKNWREFQGLTNMVWLVVEPTPLKNMLVKLGSCSPNRDEHKKYLSCHHLEFGLYPKTFSVNTKKTLQIWVEPTKHNITYNLQLTTPKSWCVLWLRLKGTKSAVNPTGKPWTGMGKEGRWKANPFSKRPGFFGVNSLLVPGEVRIFHFQKIKRKAVWFKRATAFR